MFDDYGKIEGVTRALDDFFQNKNVILHKPKYYHFPAYIIK